jgi:orotidine-5'-phosphate decarboxylase
VSAGSNPLIIALDVETPAEALRLVEQLGDSAGFYKIGMELYAAAGLDLASELVNRGKHVFLDLKLYDIGETVMRAVRQICGRSSPSFLTVHGSRAVMEAAAKGRGSNDVKLLAVTVLTSFDQDDLKDLGYEVPVSQLVDLRVNKALDSGMDGVVCSPLEVARVRAIAGPKFLLVTPGVRSAGVDKGDQKRTATPQDALLSGADYLVIGRQVTRAADPRAACEQVLSELAEGRTNAPSTFSAPAAT